MRILSDPQEVDFIMHSHLIMTALDLRVSWDVIAKVRITQPVISLKACAEQTGVTRSTLQLSRLFRRLKASMTHVWMQVCYSLSLCQYHSLPLSLHVCEEMYVSMNSSVQCVSR